LGDKGKNNWIAERFRGDVKNKLSSGLFPVIGIAYAQKVYCV
jgi:hypothetical protein